jgi:hypothetical protein
LERYNGTNDEQNYGEFSDVTVLQWIINVNLTCCTLASAFSSGRGKKRAAGRNWSPRLKNSKGCGTTLPLVVFVGPPPGSGRRAVYGFGYVFGSVSVARGGAVALLGKRHPGLFVFSVSKKVRKISGRQR